MSGRVTIVFDSNIDKVQVRRLENGYIANAERGEKPVGGRFYIPKYQRGYRWTSLQVKQLLNDINEFIYTEGSDSQYCLQPVVVQKKEVSDQWVVVDGQQRLTTIFIVLACLRCIEQRKKKTIYELEYESKPELWECLNSLGDEVDIEADPSDIDKYHITNAYRTVRKWVVDTVNNPAVEEDFATKLGTKIKEGVSFIWYEVSNDIEPETTFTRINMGKIPLTNAELIKALLLKKDNFIVKEGFKEDIKGEQTRISMAWDIMENSLHKRGFWLFLTNDKKEEQDVRIEMVFDIMARHFMQEDIAQFEDLRNTNPNTYLFLIFSWKLEEMKKEARDKAKQTSIEYAYSEVLNKFWQEINSFYQMFQDWYEEREWYHLVGYWIVARELDNKKTDVGNILYELSDIYKNESKTSFTKELKRKILKNVMGIREKDNDDSLGELSYKDLKDSFDEPEYNGGSTEKTRIHKILLLFNVVTVQTSIDCMSRFPFHEYKQTTWNLEHIHSVTTALPSNNKECEEWVDDVKKYLDSVDYFKDDENKHISKRLGEMTEFDKTSQEFKDLYADVAESFSAGKLSSEHLENGIMNMALLDEQTNKTYKNAIFPMKRKYIMDKMGRDNFVPICTKNVFLKYYTGEVTQFYVWDENDRKCYFEKMCSSIYEYLTGKKAVEEIVTDGKDE